MGYKFSQSPAAGIQAQFTSPSTSGSVENLQLRQDLAGMDYPSQLEHLQPPAPIPAIVQADGGNLDETSVNQAAQQGVSGAPQEQPIVGVMEFTSIALPEGMSVPRGWDQPIEIRNWSGFFFCYETLVNLMAMNSEGDYFGRYLIGANIPPAERWLEMMALLEADKSRAFEYHSQGSPAETIGALGLEGEGWVTADQQDELESEYRLLRETTQNLEALCQEAYQAIMCVLEEPTEITPVERHSYYWKFQDFQVGSSELRPEHQAGLDDLAVELCIGHNVPDQFRSQFLASRVRWITGGASPEWSSPRGREEGNENLARARAESVARYLSPDNPQSLLQGSFNEIEPQGSAESEWPRYRQASVYLQQEELPPENEETEEGQPESESEESGITSIMPGVPGLAPEAPGRSPDYQSLAISAVIAIASELTDLIGPVDLVLNYLDMLRGWAGIASWQATANANGRVWGFGYLLYEQPLPDFSTITDFKPERTARLDEQWNAGKQWAQGEFLSLCLEDLTDIQMRAWHTAILNQHPNYEYQPQDFEAFKEYLDREVLHGLSLGNYLRKWFQEAASRDDRNFLLQSMYNEIAANNPHVAEQTIHWPRPHIGGQDRRPVSDDVLNWENMEFPEGD
ncbi:MAG: hypothetical protein JW797_00650 [Bradymonadales bacterium]|nr:hypothetical protein [Bradymonadales bacterium]